MEPIVSLKCPNCGGDLKFNADAQNFACEWCMSDFSKEEVDEMKAGSLSPEEKQKADEAAAADEQYADDTDLYVCPSCGAEVICDHQTTASFCYYCHNPVTLAGRLKGQKKPEMIIPFTFSRLLVEKYFKDNCSKKWFLPSDFLTESQLEKITGLYVPFWLADCDLDATIIAEAKNVSTVHHGNTTVTTTRIYHVDRAAKMTYMGVPADGSEKLEDSLIDAIEPFDYSKFQKFDMSYLSGYFADNYDVDKSQVLNRIKQRIFQSAEDILRSDINGYTSVNVTNRHMRILKTTWHYVLMPVWFLTYRHHGKVYSYALNGQTGKAAGKYPVSLPKALGFAIGLGIIAAAIAMMIWGAAQ